MKHFTITILSFLIAFSATAQEADSTVAVTGEKLNFEQPRFLVSDYFSSVKAHLSKEGRKGWKPEFSLRANAELFDCSAIFTGGIRTSQNKVFGLGIGWGDLPVLLDGALQLGSAQKALLLAGLMLIVLAMAMYVCFTHQWYLKHKNR